ncbi:riboflavin synthase subunit alpha [Paenibacillus sp. J23TS9]|uniref:riboflavin synthase n=1 Tax=Paenibacillus sp. J23TS9 TaxID=2807193 RepID=UPI001B1CF48F|nr:riboflavin synthase [Paenibacillus sp. J23TS9]GIP25536.1 riboflavin synthase subunit alpha [Paenibacillus sp. J23TS9]
MFTGLVEEIGILDGITRQGEALVLSIKASVIMDDIRIGDSIAVNGVCLTATRIGSSGFSVDVTPQTYRHSNLALLKPGSQINLERAMKANGRFGGHLVQGHVDMTGTVRRLSKERNAVLIDIAPDRTEMSAYIIPQGSVTVDGVSLTIAQVDGDSFRVSIIPHTIGETGLSGIRAGSVVNIECDIIGKYVHALLGQRGTESGSRSKGINLEMLAANGFN